MPPKALPIVATGSPSAAARAASATTISIRGQCGRRRFSADQRRDRPRATARSVAGSSVGSAAQIAASFVEQRPRLRPASVRPSSGTIWLAKMITAMPAVKPTVTG